MTGINWRDAKTNPPTEKDGDEDGDVIGLTLGRIVYYVSVVRFPDCVTHWCRSDEWKDHIKSTLNPPDSPCCSSPKEDNRPENSESYSQWVYAKDRMPTKDDGDFVLWMCDEYQRPVVWRIERFGQSVSTEKNNLRWCRIPPCPSPPKRELPAVAPETFPAFVTLRNGEHAIANKVEYNNILGGLNDSIREGLDRAMWYKDTGCCLSTGESYKHDIVHVGGWLTAEELEAKRNGN